MQFQLEFHIEANKHATAIRNPQSAIRNQSILAAVLSCPCAFSQSFAVAARSSTGFQNQNLSPQSSNITGHHNLAIQYGTAIRQRSLALKSGNAAWYRNLLTQLLTIQKYNMALQSGAKQLGFTIWPHNLATQSGDIQRRSLVLQSGHTTAP